MEKELYKKREEFSLQMNQLKQKKPKLIQIDEIDYNPQAQIIEQIQTNDEIMEIEQPIILISQNIIDYDQYINKIRNFQFFENNNNVSQNMDQNEICIYTYQDYQEQKQFQITHRDYEFLNADSYLNDTIINFYLKFTMNDLQKNCKQYHIFSTFLLTQLYSDINFNYNKWVKIDIFKKDLLFFPLHCDNHWSLFIVFMPIEIRQKKCQILYLDSLGLVRPQYYHIIKLFLQKEFVRQNPLESNLYENNQIFQDIIFNQILVPKQKNSFDCGLYLLQYVEMILRNTSNFIQDIHNERFDFLSMFPRNLILLKRQHIQNLIQSIRNNQKYDFIENYIYEREEILKNSQNYDTFDVQAFNQILQARPDLNDQDKLQRYKLEFYLYKQ